MKSKLSWKNGVIYYNEKPIGDFVRDKVLSCQYKLNFEELDLYKRQIAIMDRERNRLRVIQIRRWSKRATITLSDEREFKYQDQ